MKTRLVISLLAIGLSGCVLEHPRAEILSGENLEKSAKSFNEQTKCFGEWEKMVRDWTDKSGGLAESIEETRQRIAYDNTSEFSALLREVRKRQSDVDSIKFGSWPVDALVEKEASEDFDVISEKYVSKPCALRYMAGAELFNQLRDEQSPTGYRRLAEVPKNMEWEPYQGSRYLLFWLTMNPHDADRVPHRD